MKGAAAVGLAALVAACAPAQPGPSLSIELRSEAREVELGLGFTLEVVRSYAREFVPQAFDPASLAPLEVRALGSTRRTRGGRVSETLRFQAQAFELERVLVPAPSLRVRPRGGGAERSVEGEPLELRVRSALAADPDGARPLPGPAELPGGLLLEPSPGPRLWTVGALLLLLAGAALFLRSRLSRTRVRDADRARATEAGPDPRARALARLAILKRSETRAESADPAHHIELAAALREYLDQALELPAPRRSSEELLALPRAARLLDAGQHAGLARILSACDRVKFANRIPSSFERLELLAAAEAWLIDAPPRAQRDPVAEARP